MAGKDPFPLPIKAAFFISTLILISPFCIADNILYSGDTLATGNSLQHESFNFIMQEDCNLVLYDNGDPVWASNTGGLGSDCTCTLHSDGNLMIHDGNNTPIWASDSNREDGHYVLIIQKDRNVVIYGGAIWATASNAENGKMPSIRIIGPSDRNY